MKEKTDVGYSKLDCPLCDRPALETNKRGNPKIIYDCFHCGIYEVEKDPASGYCMYCDSGVYGVDIKDCGSAGLEFECSECGSRWIA